MFLSKQIKLGGLTNFSGIAATRNAIGQFPLFTARAKKSARVPLKPLAGLANESYLPSVDGFRAVAVLIVLAAHFGLSVYVPGGFGVMLFFFISGFLITRLLIAEFEKRGSIDLKRFYIRRLIRLYPPLLLMLVIFPLALVALGNSLAWKELVAVLFYFENYYLVYFPGAHTLAGYFNIFWSLAVEEHFYLVFPLLFLLFYKHRLFTTVLCVCVVAALVTRLYYVFNLESPLLSGYDDPSYEPTYMLSHCRYDSILFGCLAALLIQKKNKVYLWLQNNIYVFGFAILILLFCFITRNDFFRNSFRYSVQGLSLMFIIPPIILSSNYGWINKMLSSKLLVQIGKMSYSLYVMHWAGIMLAGNLYPERPMMYMDVVKPLSWYLIAVPVTVALTLFSYYIVERKVIKWRKKFGSVVK